MSNQHRVYRETLKKLNETLPLRGKAQGHVATLALMITGIILGKKAHLSAIGNEAAVTMKDKSLEKRVQRWVKNQNITLETYYVPFVTAILAALAGKPLTLVLDGSVVGRGCMMLMVGVVYQHRLLPLTWTVYAGKQGQTTGAVHIRVLAAVKALLPESAQVILLGDGEYDNVELLTWLRENTTWDWVMRTASNTIVMSEGEELVLQEWGLLPGNKLGLADVAYTRQQFGPVLVVGWWRRDCETPLYLVTNLELLEEACHWYRRRFRIETLFSDAKGRGFHVDKSHLADPARLSRLLIAMSLAYVWMLRLGVQVVHRQQVGLIDRTDRQDLSLFQLGLRWLTYLLKHERPLEVLFTFPFACPLGSVR